MRKLIATEWMSLDGVVQAPSYPEEDRSGGFDRGGWHTRYFDDLSMNWVVETVGGAGGYVLGRGTYEIFAGHWPSASEEEQALAEPLNTRPKSVASTTLIEPLEWQHSALLRGDVGEAVRALKAEDGDDLLVIGSPGLVQSLLAHDLLDEVRVMIDPLLVGAGKRLFGHGNPLRPLRLVESLVTRTQDGDRGARSHGRPDARAVSATRDIEDLLRDAAPRVLAAVARRFGDFTDAEDATQEAMLVAAQQWPRQGTPGNPVGWLIHVASLRLIDRARSDTSRREREAAAAAREPRYRPAAGEHDDTLALMFMSCHPELTPASAIALTLRAVAGLATADIAAAFLVPEATMTQRISRAKRTIKTSGIAFAMPTGEEWAARLRSVLHILYLIFNEGYLATGGPQLARADLSREAIRLARIAHRALPDDPEVAGLLALMLLTEARRAARTTAGGELVPLDEQDRSLVRHDEQLVRVAACA